MVRSPLDGYQTVTSQCVLRSFDSGWPRLILYNMSASCPDSRGTNRPCRSPAAGRCMAGAGAPTNHRGRERSQNICESRTNTELVRPSVQGIIQTTPLFAASVLMTWVLVVSVYFSITVVLSVRAPGGRRDSVLQ